MAATDFKDYYATLGVSRSASADEIKQAFRRLARKYHPDVNPGDRQAESMFKEINEAHEVLSDPEKRQKYDQFGQYWKQASQGQTWSPGAGGANFEDMEFGQYSSFEDFVNALLGRYGAGGVGSRGGYRSGASTNFTDMGGGGRSSVGTDRELTLSLSLSEAFHGVQKRLNLGSEMIDVRIPAGTRQGNRIRVRGKGGFSPYGQQRGDLYLVVDLQPHSFFKFEGDNLICEVAIAPDEAVLGGQIEVPTPDGMVTVNIPAGIRSGQSLRLRGKGWPNPKGGRTDQLVQVVIIPPKDLSAVEREYYEKIRSVRSFNPRAELKQIRL